MHALIRARQLGFYFPKRALLTRYYNTPRPENTVSTLDPTLLSPSDYLDLSQRRSFTVPFPKSSYKETSRIVYCTKHDREDFREDLPFPPKTAGFLYYHRELDAAPLEGSIRFRVTSENSPSSFLNGQDLLLPSGSPWQILLPQLAVHSRYTRIRDQLLHEKLATEQQFSECLTLFRDHRLRRPEFNLFRLSQQFPIGFSQGIYLTIISTPLHMLEFSRIFTAFIDQEVVHPWTGSAIAHFEASTRPEHANRRVVHLRIVRVVEPLSCAFTGYERTGRILKPQDGQLLTVRHPLRPLKPPAPWEYDIDKKRTLAAVALRALWDITMNPRP
ncbi:hypothetical protein MVEN_01185100 [Mycena venus]|uniref:Uncharacterized protein n=1 Tax=Mycena venus TaxID=2733690 RepID=A0A8H6Y1A4_9AGAR|nr:hypothetical protein MVEN_01185100 [Mycena venus]